MHRTRVYPAPAAALTVAAPAVPASRAATIDAAHHYPDSNRPLTGAAGLNIQPGPGACAAMPFRYPDANWREPGRESRPGRRTEWLGGSSKH